MQKETVFFDFKKKGYSETLNRNILMPVNHILQTIDDAPNICPMKIKP